MTLVRVNTFCIRDGSRRRVGQEFDYNGTLPDACLDIIEEGAPAPSFEEPKQQMGAKKQTTVKSKTEQVSAAADLAGNTIPSVLG